jgi:hypothetical protein
VIYVAKHYRYTGTALYRDGDVVEPGDVIEPTEAELEAFGDVLEAVHEREIDAETTPESPTIESPPIDPSEYTVDELQDALEDADYDWTDATLRGLRQAEVDGQNRDTALEAIDAELED